MTQWAPPVQQQPPVRPPQRRTSWRLWLILLAVILVALVVVVAVSGGTQATHRSAPAKTPTPPSAARTQSTAPAPTVPATVTVQDVVTSDAPLVNVTYTTASGGEAQANDQSVPFGRMFTNPQAGFHGLAAQAQGGSFITCSVSVNGTVVKTNTSTGPYAVVTCAATV